MSEKERLEEARQRVHALNLYLADLFSRRRQLPGIHGQVVGAEAYRIEFTGHEQGRMNDLIDDIMALL